MPRMNVIHIAILDLILQLSKTNPLPLTNEYGSAVQCPSVQSIAPDYGYCMQQANSPALQNNTGSIYGISCQRFFSLVPLQSSIRECQSNGTWSQQDAICVPNEDERCEAPHLPEHSVPDSPLPEEFPIFHVIELGCEAGYRGSGNSTVQCDNFKSWRVDWECGRSCEELVLGPGVTVRNSSSHPGDSNSSHPGDNSSHAGDTAYDYTAGTVVELECLTGYRPNGNNTALCSDEGAWTNSFTCCKTCPGFTSADASIPGTSEFCENEQIIAATLALTCLDCWGELGWYLEGCQEYSFYTSYREFIYIPALLLAIGIIVVLGGLLLKVRSSDRNRVISAEMIKIRPARGAALNSRLHGPEDNISIQVQSHVIHNRVAGRGHVPTHSPVTFYRKFSSEDSF